MTYNVKEIAKKCGMSTRAVYEYAEKIGIQKQGGRWRFTLEQAERILNHYGYSLNDEPQDGESAEFAESAEQSAENAEFAAENAENDAESAEFAEQSAESADGASTAIKALSKQLEVKDKQIEGYIKTIENMIKAQEEMTKAQEEDRQEIRDLRQQVRALIGNVSLLNAADKRDLLTQGDTQEQAEVIEVKQAQEQQIQEHETRSMTRWEHLRAFFTGK